MDYELFQASAVKAFGHCRDIKAMVSDIQQVLSAVPDMVRKNERLRKENAALKAELDDWKGNAEGFQPDEYMRLPVDADGVPIRIGDTVWFEDKKSIVTDITLSCEGWDICTDSDGYGFGGAAPETLSHKKPEPADSWEKLIGDLRDAVSSSKYACECAYLNPEEDNCGKCPALNQVCSGYAIADILARIERLRGEGND